MIYRTIASINTSTIYLTIHTVTAQCYPNYNLIQFLPLCLTETWLFCTDFMCWKEKKNIIPRKLKCSSQLPLKCSSKWCFHSNTSAFSVSCSTFFGTWDIVIISDFHDMLYGCHGKWLYQESRRGYILPVHQSKLRTKLSEQASCKLWLQPCLSSLLNNDGVQLNTNQ